MWRTWSANVEVIVAAKIIMAESANQNGSRASVARPGRCKSAPPHASLPMMTRQRTPFSEEGPNLTKAGKPWAGLGKLVRTRRTGQGNGSHHEWVRAVPGGQGHAENARGEGVCVCLPNYRTGGLHCNAEADVWGRGLDGMGGLSIAWLHGNTVSGVDKLGRCRQAMVVIPEGMTSGNAGSVCDSHKRRTAFNVDAVNNVPLLPSSPR
jgi:hypothetical protein